VIEIKVTGNPMDIDQQVVSLIRRVSEEMQRTAQLSCVVQFELDAGKKLKFRMSLIHNQQGAPRRQAAPDGARMKE